MGSLPSSYLGLPLGAPFKFVVAWDRVEERFYKRLAMWKRQYISKGERITMIQSTLSSLPIYFVFALHATNDQIEARADLKGLYMGWWGSRVEATYGKMGNYLFRKMKGGLGVTCRSMLNKTLFCKWNWHFENEKKKDPLEWNYQWEVWRRRKGVVFSGSKGGVWCQVLESHQEGLGPFK